MAIWKTKNVGEREGEGKEPEQRGKDMSWLVSGVCVCFCVSVLFTLLYGMFRTEVESRPAVILATENNAGWLYQSTFLLYRDLYNSQNQVQENYVSLYLEPDEDYEWLIEDDILNRYQADESSLESLTESVMAADTDAACLLEEVSALKILFKSMEDSFGTLSGLYDYVIEDNNTGFYLSNMSPEGYENLSSADYYFRLGFSFDNAGNVTVADVYFDKDELTLRRVANQTVRDTLRLETLMKNFISHGTIRQPKNCKVTYYIPYWKWQGSVSQFYQLDSLTRGIFSIDSDRKIDYYNFNGFYRIDNYRMYIEAGVSSWVLLFITAVFLLGCFLPLRGAAPWRDKGICAQSLEFLVIIGIILLSCIALIVGLTAAVASGEAVSTVRGFLYSHDLANAFVIVCNLVLLSLFYFGFWYLGVSIRALREMGLGGYIKNRSLIYRFFPFVRRQFKKIYDYILRMDLTESARRTIRKIVIVNALILLVISSLWLGGLMVTVVYSVLLYIILRKYVSDLQKRYGILLKAVDEMADGNLNVTIEEDLGVFEPFKPQIIKIQSGFKKAVDEEVKSQHMKAELITNVSHDLKTPLTAIITYINLLKDDNLSPEKRIEYLDTLEKKSLRLKVLIEDLFEVSKATSGNVTLNLMPVDIMSLIKQVYLEMKDKLDEAQLDIRMNLTDEKVVLPLDSQKTYRIYENLFGNIAKYALHGTRVYINGFRIDDTIVITFKNISAQEITVDSSELTERFVRGDASRNTEGSGLGLAITKSFTELQGGQLQLEVDGDLFKAITTWRL